MKKVSLLVAVLLLAAACFADPVNPLDPKMIVSGTGGRPTPIGGPTVVKITSVNFVVTLTVNAQGIGSTPLLQNHLPGKQTIHTLYVAPPTIAYNFFNGVSCQALQFFTSCTPPSGPGGNWTFFGGPGILYEQDFLLSVNGFNPGTYNVPGVASPSVIPEPGTIALIVPGVLGLVRLRRSF